MQPGNPQDAYLLQLMLSGQFGGGQFGTASGWLSVAYLVCLFCVIIFKPERVRNLSLFRRACWLFAMSLIAPIFISIATNALSTASGITGTGPNLARVLTTSPFSATIPVQLLFQFLVVVGPLLFGLSVLCALISIVPTFIPPPDVEPFVASREPRPSIHSFGGPPAT